MAEIVFLRGVSEIQCLVYQQNNANPFETCKNWIQVNMVFHVIILFFREYENLISASNFSDFIHIIFFSLLDSDWLKSVPINP